MTSSEDEGLKKKAPSTQIKTWIIIIPVKNSDSVEYPRDTRSRWVIPNDGVTFILLYIEVALTHSVTRLDFMWAYREEMTLRWQETWSSDAWFDWQRSLSIATIVKAEESLKKKVYYS